MEIFLSAPDELPEGYVASVRDALADDPDVRSAHLFKMTSPMDDEPNVVLAIETDDPDADFVQFMMQYGEVAARPLEEMGYAVSVTRTDELLHPLPKSALEVYVRG